MKMVMGQGQHEDGGGYDPGPTPVWFSIDSKEGELNPGDADFASNISTNLKKLSDAEMTVLLRHAGALCEARIRRWTPELIQ